MTTACVSAPQWAISNRTRGEVLAASARDSGLELWLLGVPEGFTVAEMEGWLHDLLGVARETSRSDAGPRPIPCLLHHALTGLLFSHSEMWNAAASPGPNSLAFVQSGDKVGFGWVGDALVHIWVDDQPLETPWVIVRDPDGREARACAVDAARKLRVSLEWTPRPDDPAIAGIALDAEWPGAAVPEAVGGGRVAAAEATLLQVEATAVEAGTGGPAEMTPSASDESEVMPPTEPVPARADELGAVAQAEPEAPPVDDALAALIAEIDERAESRAGNTPAADGVGGANGAAATEESAETVEGASPWHKLGFMARLRRILPWGRRKEQAGELPAAEVVEPAARPPEELEEPAAMEAEEPATEAAEELAEPAVAGAQEPAAELPEEPAAELPEEFAEPAVETEEPPAESPEEFAEPAVAEAEEPAAEAPVEFAEPAAGASEEPTRPPVLANPARLAVETAAIAGEGAAAPLVIETAMIVDEMVATLEAPRLEAARIRAVPVAPVVPCAIPGVPERIPPAPEPPEPPAQAAGEQASSAPAEVVSREPVLGGGPAAGPARVGIEAAPSSPGPQAETTPELRPAAIAPVMPLGREVESGVPSPAPSELASQPAPEAGPIGAADQPAAAPESELAAGAVPELATAQPAALETGPFAETARITAGTPLQPNWPTPEQLEAGPTAWWKRPWAWAALVVGLVAGGWLVGSLQGGRGQGPAGSRGLLGFGGARYEVMVNSRPQGAWIAVDGRDLGRRTPASVELKPGPHRVALSFSNLGSAGYDVRGSRGQQLTLDAVLWGSITVSAADDRIPVAVTVDGAPRGFAPVKVDSLLPGVHELGFSGPGLPAWRQSVELRVNQAAEVLARPMTSPATGVIAVRAVLSDPQGDQPASGAQLWVDGELRGTCPATLELPRGPHSLRVVHRGMEAPVQVIDLPGGNQRFATFEFGLTDAGPRLALLAPPARIPFDHPTVLAADLDGLGPGEVREMWLHVRTPDGPWRRYQMMMMKAPGGVVGAVVFPLALFDAQGKSRYYVSASSVQGDEYFSEILGVQLAVPPPGATRPIQ